jgi:tetratricopeptide (TPR) repeat protein
MTRLFSAASALAVLGSLFVSSCGFSQVNAARSDYRLGLAAERSGDLAKARQYQFAAYRQATLLDITHIPVEASYEYARLSGYAGDSRAADEAFRESLRLMDKDIEVRFRMRLTVITEYARFLYDQGRYDEAIVYYDEAVARQAKRLPGHDTLSFAEFLEEYGGLLSRSKRKADAAKVRSRAAEFRSAPPDMTLEYPRPSPLARKTEYPRRHYPRKLQPGQRLYPRMDLFPKVTSPEEERRRYSPSAASD